MPRLGKFRKNFYYTSFAVFYFSVRIVQGLIVKYAFSQMLYRRIRYENLFFGGVRTTIRNWINGDRLVFAGKGIAKKYKTVLIMQYN